MDLKFICLNAWHGNRLEELIAFLKTEDADVVALQEATSCADGAAKPHHRVAEACIGRLGYPHAAYAPAFYADVGERRVTDGNLVLSRFPVTGQQVTFYDVPFGPEALEPSPGAPVDWVMKPRNFQDVNLDLGGGRELHVLNTQGIWGFDPDDNPRRLAAAARLNAAARRHPLAVVCGDMNVREGTASAERMGEGLRNVFGSMLTTSFNMEHKEGGSFGDSVVDMVFVSSGLEVVSREIPGGSFTDHVPLVCTLRLT